MKSISDALHISRDVAKGTSSENIYIYWGLHFTTVKKGISSIESRKMVGYFLHKSFAIWLEKIKTETRENIRENIQELINWIRKQLITFIREDLRK